VSYTNKLAIRDSGPEVQNVIIGIIGRKGTGKSTITREILKRSRRLFVFDTANDHGWIPDTFVQIDEAVLFIFDKGTSEADYKARYIPEEEEEDDALVRDVNEIAKMIWETGNVCFVIEELPMMSSAQWAPAKVKRLFRLGRHRGINLLYTGQRAAEIPRIATHSTDVFILFHTSEPLDLDRISERCGPECAAVVSALGDHEFVVFDVRQKSLIEIDSQWYDSVLISSNNHTPAIGGRTGRSARWSFEDAE